MKKKLVYISIELAPHFIMMEKKHWWSRWVIVMNGNIPKIFFPKEITGTRIPIENMKEE